MQVQPPPQDPAQIWAIMDHMVGIGGVLVGAAVTALAWLIRRIRWSDRIAEEIKAGRVESASQISLVGKRFDQMEARQQRWETEVKGQIADVRDEFRGEFTSVHERVDNILLAGRRE